MHLGYTCFPLPAALSLPGSGTEKTRIQPPKVTWLFPGLDLCQQQHKHEAERALGEVREGPLP